MTIQAKEHITARDLEHLNTIERGTFIGNVDLIESVEIPSSVTTIGEGAFSRCSGLTSVTIPDSVTTIGEMAFYGCSGLTSVTIPDSVTTIGKYAFDGCSGLTSVTIPGIVNDYPLKGGFDDKLFKALIRSSGNLDELPLPDELARNIVRYLEPKDVGRASLTSKGKPKPN
jgi:hypothetical protein